MKSFFYLFFVFAIGFAQAQTQDSTRITINGKIIVDSPDLEGITVYNSSSNKGTVTNKKGEFTIKAMLNDKINVSALQFKDFNVAVAQEVIDSKVMNVYLVEEVNKLDEVVILPYDLTGVLEEDVANVNTVNPDMNAIYFGINDISAYEFADDQYSKVENLAAMTPNERITTKEESKSLGDTYKPDYFIINFKIPEDQVEAFIVYVETNNFDTKLLSKGQEMQLIEHLNNQSQQFLKLSVEKD